ncbi:nucleoplasmin-like protein ANO39 [Saccostrea echinata]|uniref:nucleoplasmin-like protein ANO39 n=1 Tax=Saccostrea echinata TaxID=191078 RepID=UPI002A80D5C7|nr:nucleoplasmin-like protein ANO39 [Saccostrea echinata]
MLRRRKLRDLKAKAEEYESVLFPKDDKNDSDDSSDEDGEDISLNIRSRTQDDESEEEEAGSEEDDEVPEAVSFSSGRKAALQEMKTALQQIGQNKQKVKDKRRQLNEQFKLQKQKKLEDLAKKKLSEDFFDDLPEAIPKENNLKRKAVNTDHSKQAKDSEDEESFADTEEDFEINDDFIPLEERLGGVTVEKVKENEKKIMSSVEQARQFKQQRLYGGKIPRMTNDSLIALKGKRRARYK